MKHNSRAVRKCGLQRRRSRLFTHTFDLTKFEGVCEERVRINVGDL